MWTCSSGAAHDCVGTDQFDPPVRTLQGEPLCLACAKVLGLVTPHGRTDESDREDVPAREDTPYGVTD